MTDWRNRAACRGKDGERWFPLGRSGTPTYEQQVTAAKDVCHACPVRASCLDWALTLPQEFGIAGGLTEEERAAIRKSLVPPATETTAVRLRASAEAVGPATAAKDAIGSGAHPRAVARALGVPEDRAYQWAKSVRVAAGGAS